MSALVAPPEWEVGPVTRTDFVRYQGASGDFQPLHHDETAARAAGFPSPFSVGMWQAGLVATYATDWLGPEHVRRFRVRFSEQVWPGDVLVIRCESVAEEVRDGTPYVDVELSCTRRGGGRAVTVWASFVREETS